MCPTYETHLRTLLENVKDGKLSVDESIAKLGVLPFENLGFAKVDHHRTLRKGFPEVILGLGKSPDQIVAIVSSMLDKSDRLLVTKTSPKAFKAIYEKAPDAVYDSVANTIVVDRRKERMQIPGILVVSGGTADLPVAREAIITAELMDCKVEHTFDVGVAGLHRLLNRLSNLRKARVIVTVAGMEGALPSVVSGLVEAPVIAVPTSVGYGSHFGGLTALLSMLNSCAEGVAVVNIDNGFGAGYLAALIAKGMAPK